MSLIENHLHFVHTAINTYSEVERGPHQEHQQAEVGFVPGSYSKDCVSVAKTILFSEKPGEKLLRDRKAECAVSDQKYLSEKHPDHPNYRNTPFFVCY